VTDESADKGVPASHGHGSAAEVGDAPGAFRRLLLRGSLFELIGHGGSMAMRLAGNIVLSRLLFPKAFGLSAEVSFVLYGLVMFSDVGLRQCVIRSARGDDPAFVNTAFTMQALRGVAMTILGLLVAIPMARYWFHEPDLTAPLMGASFQQLVAGLNSTALLTLRRRLRLGVVNALDLGQQLISLTVMVIWARLHPSVWALLGGSLVGATFFAAASHFLPVGYRNRFSWDRAAYRELSSFGRWILGSSSVSFLANQGDRALFGRFLGATQLGVYQIAAELSGTAGAVVERLVGGVLYPALSTKGRDNDRPELRRLYYKSRVGLDVLAQGGLGLLCGVGGWLIRLVWDPRYWGAAWMLPLLCIRGAMSCLVMPTETCLVAMGLARYGFVRSLARGVTVWIAIPLGFFLGGVPGLLWGVALTELPALLLLWISFGRLRMLRVERELLAVLIFLGALALGTVVNRWLPAWHIPHGHH